MDVRTAWRRLDAEHWVHVWGVVATTLLVIGSLVAVIAGFAVSTPVMAVFPVALAALSGWLTSAWRRERPWAWWVWTIGSAVGFATALDGLASGRGVAAASLAASGILLVLLFHPDSRARVERPSVPLSR